MNFFTRLGLRQRAALMLGMSLILMAAQAITVNSGVGYYYPLAALLTGLTAVWGLVGLARPAIMGRTDLSDGFDFWLQGLALFGGLALGGYALYLVRSM